MSTSKPGAFQPGAGSPGSALDDATSYPGTASLSVVVGQPTVAGSSPGTTDLTVSVAGPTVSSSLTAGTTAVEVTVGSPTAAASANPGSATLTVTVANASVGAKANFSTTYTFVQVGQPLSYSSGNAYSFFVGTNDVTLAASDYFDATRSPLSVSRELNGSSSASFGLISKDGSYTPAVGQDVRFMLGSNTVFAGNIQEFTEETLGESSARVYSVSATDYNAILDRRIVFRNFKGYSAYEIVRNLVETYLDSEGIVWVDEGDPNVDFEEEIVFNGITLADALSRMRGATNWETWIDDDKGFHFFDPDAGWGAAPISLAQGDGNILMDSCKVRRYRGNYANVQWVRSSLGLGGSFSETQESAPGLKFKITKMVTPNWHSQGQPFPPKIFIEGASGDIPSAVPWHWLANFDPALYQDYEFDGMHWTAGTNEIDPDNKWQARIVREGNNEYLVLNEFDPSVQAIGEVQSVTVDTPLTEGINQLVKSTNTSQVAARQAIEGGSGLWEHIEDIGDVESAEEAQAMASALLARKDAIPVEVTFDTITPGWKPGQTVTMNLSRPLVPSADYLIQKVSATEYSNSLSAASPFLKWSVQAVSGSAQLLPLERARRERARERANRNTNVATIDILLAKTINGATNPGLEVGSNSPNNIVFVQQKGRITQWVAVANTAPTGADIQIDVLRQVKGIGSFTSILPTGQYITIKDGRSLGLLMLSTDNVVQVDVEDRLRFDVIQAGSTEKGKDIWIRGRLLV